VSKWRSAHCGGTARSIHRPKLNARLVLVSSWSVAVGCSTSGGNSHRRLATVVVAVDRRNRRNCGVSSVHRIAGIMCLMSNSNCSRHVGRLECICVGTGLRDGGGE
jgi:hypothetical protein